jgi:Fic family protein
MNLILLQSGYPPAVIRKEDRKAYIDSIERVQLGGSRTLYDELMYKAVDRSLDIYLDAVENKTREQTLEEKTRMRIGELAKRTKETVPTIRHWTHVVLLSVAEYTKSGYYLYESDAVARVKEIRMLQNTKRWTLEEIKKSLV